MGKGEGRAWGKRENREKVREAGGKSVFDSKMNRERLYESRRWEGDGGKEEKGRIGRRGVCRM